MNHVPSPAPTSSDSLDELAIRRAKADVAPRVTPADIEANITSEHFFTPREACEAQQPGSTWPDSLGLLTICVLVLKNGFTVTGESACASAANFNADIGKSIARANAVAKIWPLMGYELRSKLTTPAVRAYVWSDIQKIDAKNNIITGDMQGRVQMTDGSLFTFVLEEESNINTTWSQAMVLNQINNQTKEKRAG